MVENELKLLSSNIYKIIEYFDYDKGILLQNEFAGIRAAINQYYRYKDAKKFEGKQGDLYINSAGLHDFETCSLCWRFVPKKSKAYNKKYYCRFHTYDPSSPVPQTEYNLALKFNHNRTNYEDSPEPPLPLPGTASQIFKQLRECLRTQDGDIPFQDWIDTLCQKLSRLDLDFFPNVEYDLAPLWRICPNVHRYIIEHGGNEKSPESILEILDPETPNEEEEFNIERKCAHKIFTKNFALYKRELALAESYLSEYYLYIDNHPQGGKRPRTGGKRNGAGRKPKKR